MYSDDLPGKSVQNLRIISCYPDLTMKKQMPTYKDKSICLSGRCWSKKIVKMKLLFFVVA